MASTLKVEYEVLDFLKKEVYRLRNRNLVLTYNGVTAKDMVKLMERTEECCNWQLNFVCLAIDSIDKIKQRYLIPYPKIEDQTEEDRVLSKLLSKNKHFVFGSNTFFKENVTVDDVISYMQRNDEIKNWTAFSLDKIQKETLRVKQFLL